MENPRGTTCKITGSCNQIEIVSELLEREFIVVHKSRVIVTPNSNQCHVYLSLAEVITND